MKNPGSSKDSNAIEAASSWLSINASEPRKSGTTSKACEQVIGSKLCRIELCKRRTSGRTAAFKNNIDISWVFKSLVVWGIWLVVDVFDSDARRALSISFLNSTLVHVDPGSTTSIDSIVAASI